MTEPLISQIFCSVSDLVADNKAPSAAESQIYQRCRDASDYLQHEIGPFVPVHRTLQLPGSDRRDLLIPPLLSIDSLIYQGLSLTENVDYILRPERRRWPYGPYTWLEAAPYSTRVGVWQCESLVSAQLTPVQLTGTVGLYDRSVATGAVVDDAAGQTNAQLTLQADNGGLVSPGMQLKIGSEQQLVTGWGAPLDSGAQLSAGIAVIDQSLTLDDPTKVHVGETIRVDFEQCKVLDVNATQIYVARGWNHTQAVVHLIHAKVEAYRSVTVDRGLNGTAAASHAKTTAISRYTVPDDILFLAKEIAALMTNKALSGYQGRSGGSGNDQGVVFYNDAFPRADIDRIKALYSIPEAG